MITASSHILGYHVYCDPITGALLFVNSAILIYLTWFQR